MPRVQFSSMSQLGEALPLLISYQPQNAMAVALFTEGCFAGACVVPLCDSPDELMGALDMTREAARNGRGHRVMVVPVLFGTLRPDCADLFAAWKLVVEVESGEPVEHVVTVAGPVASCSCGVCDDHRVDVPSELTGAMTLAGCKVHPTRDDLGAQVAINPVAAQLVADWLAAHAAVSEAEGRAAWAALLSGCKPSVARAAQPPSPPQANCHPTKGGCCGFARGAPFLAALGGLGGGWLFGPARSGWCVVCVCWWTGVSAGGLSVGGCVWSVRAGVWARSACPP